MCFWLCCPKKDKAKLNEEKKSIELSLDPDNDNK